MSKLKSEFSPSSDRPKHDFKKLLDYLVDVKRYKLAQIARESGGEISLNKLHAARSSDGRPWDANFDEYRALYFFAVEKGVIEPDDSDLEAIKKENEKISKRLDELEHLLMQALENGKIRKNENANVD